MDLENRKKTQSHDKNVFTVSFFNDIENNNLSKLDVSYIFSKFGSVRKIKYVQDGKVLVFYKEKQGAQKAMEIMECAQKYFFRPILYVKPKDKSETTQRTKINNSATMSGPFDFGQKIIPDPFQQIRLKKIKNMRKNHSILSPVFSTLEDPPKISPKYRQPFTAGLKFRGRGIQTRHSGPENLKKSRQKKPHEIK